MPIKVPKSGFFVHKNKAGDTREVLQRVNGKVTDKILLNNDTVILASTKAFGDQGLWTDSESGIAYDLDLTNQDELAALVDVQNDEEDNKGELIWLLYKKYGIQFCEKLRGAYAFAIWDNDCKSLFVITDAYGIKPVVYSKTGKGFFAGSRIRYLLWADPEFKDINPDAIFNYLFFQAICSPLTIYKKISKLEPGKGLHLTEKLSCFTHYDIHYHPNHALSENDWKQAIRKQLEVSVGKFAHLSSYEKTGCFLSGGTDSSSIAGYYTSILKKPAKTFSIGFDDPVYNELGYARIAAEKFGVDYHEYYVTPQDVMDLIEHLPSLFDEPFGNASVIPAFYCARHAAQNGIEVLLGGDGGDEIFGGNERYVTNLIFQKYLSVPKPFRNKIFEPLLERMPDKGILHRAKRYVRRANIPNPERFYSYNLLSEINSHEIFQEEFASRVNFDSFINIARMHYENAAPANDTDRLLYLDMKFTITDNDIKKVTQMVEAAGLKVRYPLLDRELVDFSATIPPNLKVRWRKNRYIFKQAMLGFLPDEIIHKSKHGMGLPVTPWFRKDRQMNAFLYDTLFTEDTKLKEYIKPGFMEEIRSSFETDSTSYYGDNLWVFLMLELWMRKTSDTHE